MVALYVRCIKEGKITLDKVPSRWYEAVKAELIAQGLYEESEEDGEN